ncbi:helix-turn-helix domain-containing protein [Barnesiella intestinihominis]|uniref:helix-turn-helix domain-containing protein n=1 Tax=Barnesiella intestinihominis TaxID=487174 RepID=UPI003AB86BE6
MDKEVCHFGGSKITQRLLKNSSMTIQQISNELNFPSQTFFSKYFKHQIGLSPKEYRKS